MRIVIDIPKDKLKLFKKHEMMKYPRKALSFVDLTDFAGYSKTIRELDKETKCQVTFINMF